MVLSLVADSRKRRRSSADASCVDHLENGSLQSSSNKLRDFEICHLQVGMCVCSANLCVNENFADDLGHAAYKKSHASCGPSTCSADHGPSKCGADDADSALSSTGSSCCSSLPGHENSPKDQQTLLCMGCPEAEAESWSFCAGDGASEVDVACFFHDDEICDDASNESFSFNPEAIFANEPGFTDCGSSEDAPLVDCSAENGSWFLNDLDNQGQAFLNEVLDQEWMAAAVANLEKLNDTLSADSCVLHLLESDHCGKGY